MTKHSMTCFTEKDPWLADAVEKTTITNNKTSFENNTKSQDFIVSSQLPRIEATVLALSTKKTD